MAVSVAVLCLAFLVPDALGYGFDSPRVQIASGVDLEDIGCNDVKVLVVRPGNIPSCMSEATAQRMSWPVIARTFHIPEKIQPASNSTDTEITESSALLKNSAAQPEIQKTNPGLSDAIKDPQTHVIGESITTIDKICQDYLIDTPVEPSSYSITGGKFLGLCINAHYRWFDIYLDMDTGGSITLEIPKDTIDLKQYDYLDCHTNRSYYFDGEKRSWDSYSVKQIAQSDNSRTLHITFYEPVESISNFWGYSVTDGVDYSQPNYCISEYENNNYDPAGHLPREEPNYQPDPPKCQTLLDLNYTITGGQVDEMCGRFGPNNHEEDYPLRGYALDIYLSGIKSLEYLTVEIPWYVLPPNRLAEYDDYAEYDNKRFVDPNEYNTYANKKIFDSEDCISTEITAVTPEYYRLEIPIKPNEKVIRYGIIHNSGIQLDISEIVDSIRPPTTSIDDLLPPFGYSDELDMLRIAPFDKNVDGKSVKYCDIIPNSYTDDFDDLDNWRFGDGNWHIMQPYEGTPNENNQTNMVASSSNCGTECIMYLRQSLDATRELLITFDRFISDDVDHDEGLYVQYYHYGVGEYWITLASYTENNNMNTERWTSTNLVLDVPLDTTHLRFLAQSDAIDEIIEIDNLSITPNRNQN